MAKKKKFKKYGTFVRTIYKRLKGKRTKFVNVTIKTRKGTTNKQYKYRGGRFSTYIQEATIKARNYYVDYSKGLIYKGKRELDKLNKSIKALKPSKRAKRPISKKKALKKLRIIPKRHYKPPKPIGGEKIVNFLKGKVDYEREHSVLDFITKQKEDKFLIDIISRGTKTKQQARQLVANFPKIGLKFSYVCVVEGVDREGNFHDIAHFNVIAKKPSHIIDTLRKVNLMPGDDYLDVYSDIMRPYRNSLNSNKVTFNKTSGDFRITDVRMTVKFYNNPQTSIRQF